MPDTISVKEYWENRILGWEESRYGQALNPFSWTVRSRLRRASAILRERCIPGCSVLELGCGSGILAVELENTGCTYIGFDVAANAIERARERKLPAGFQFHAGDVTEVNLPWADVTVFLGLSDWLSPDQLSALFSRVRSPRILFSYTGRFAWNPYGLYRRLKDAGPNSRHARTYERSEIEAILSAAGFSMETVVPPAPHNPGSLVWAKKI